MISRTLRDITVSDEVGGGQALRSADTDSNSSSLLADYAGSMFQLVSPRAMAKPHRPEFSTEDCRITTACKISHIPARICDVIRYLGDLGLAKPYLAHDANWILASDVGLKTY